MTVEAPPGPTLEAGSSPTPRRPPSPPGHTGVSGGRERGFTLLEVLVAFAIAALAVGALVQGVMGGLRSAHASGHHQEAVSRARSRLAAFGHGAPLVPGGQEGDDGGGFRWRTRVVRLAVAAPPRDAGRPSPDRGEGVALYAVSVAVSWRMDGGLREVVLDSRRVGPAGAREGP